MSVAEPVADFMETQWADEQKRAYFAKLSPRRTALLVIDMQNHWVDKDGMSYVATAKDIVPNINRLASSLRDAGGHVFWIVSSFGSSGRKLWPMLFEDLENPVTGAATREEITPGHNMHALWPGLDVQQSDHHVHKDRFSAFIAGSSNLERQLRDLGCDTIVVTGVATHICCESTARDGMMLDFRTIMVEDGNAARSREDHLAGLRTVARVFGCVMTTDQLTHKISADD